MRVAKDVMMAARTFLLALIIATAALLAPPSAYAQFASSGERYVDASLHSARAAVAPGETFTIVLRQQIADHWHTYWRNPGDSGEATELSWTLPQGWSAGEIHWPTPEAIPFAILVNYGYSNEVLFPVTLTVPRNAAVGSEAILTADGYWLVCSDICIPEEMQLTLAVPIASAGRDDPEWAPRIAQAVANLPQAAPFEARVGTGSVRLSAAVPGATEIRNPYFFPFSRDAINHAAPQQPRVGEGGLSFTLEKGVSDTVGTEPLEGVITYETQRGGAWVRTAYEVRATPGAPLPNTDTRAATVTEGFVGAAPENVAGNTALSTPTNLPTFWTALLFAFLGGLILNIMPCVLPVLSIKALSLASGAQRGEAQREGVFFFLGVMTTFLALAGVLIALQAGGAAIGWGFQLQEPLFVGGLATLFFLIGLNLLGVFEIGGSVQNVGSGLAARGGDLGAFFTGALAVVAATPCTAWFMGGAMGFAASQPWFVALVVFAMLGVGFALPFTTVAFLPAFQRLIPKPGVWMDRVKQFLAFPMFATVVWLVWVLVGQAGSAGVAVLLSVFVAIAFLIWALKSLKSLAWRAGALVFALVLVAGVAQAMRPSDLISEAWSPARLEELRAEGRPIFVNFTADWCVTCKVNEGATLSRDRVTEGFAEAGVVYLKADWTNRNAEIAAALAEHGRAGVPLYVYYPADGGEPVVLPQMLSEDLVLDTIRGGAQ